MSFFFRTPLLLHPLRGPSEVAHGHAQPTDTYGRRLAGGECSAESATMSTFAVPEIGREGRLAAKERAAAKARSADQRSGSARCP